ncbi:MAG: DUF349 domain-containing protein [Myxococcota bacterium]
MRSVRAGKGEAHWEKFRRACDEIYARIKAGHAENLAQREELCRRAESWKDSTDWRGTAAALRDLQAVWKTLGPVARADDARTWGRFRGACDEFFERRKAATAVLDREHEANANRKTLLIDKVEALVATVTDETTHARATAEVKRIRGQWRDIGHAPRAVAARLQQRFAAACDAVVGKLDAMEREQAAEARRRREAHRVEVAAVLDAEDPDPKSLVLAWSRVHTLSDDALERRCYEACAEALARSPSAFAGTELAPVNALRRKRKLCERVEAMAGPAGESPALAEQLEAAIARRAIAGTNDGDPAQLEATRTKWRRIGPTPGDEGAALDQRFADAVERALAQP